jgi:membrane protease YdiL (CAAX protease family)
MAVKDRGALTQDRAVPALVFVGFLVGGLMLFLLGNNWQPPRFPTNESKLYKWGIAVLFLLLSYVTRRSKRFRACWEVFLVLFIASFANALSSHTGNWLAGMLPRPVSSAEAVAVDKLSESVPVVASILLLTRLSGKDLGSIFLKKGDLRWGMRFGVVSFAIFAAIFAVIAVLQASAPVREGLAATGVPLAAILAAIPWILAFCLANSLMEELWFRGIFLGKLSPLLGARASVAATAFVFALPHAGAGYITAFERVIFPAAVFVLGLVNGYVMLKSDSIWGSMLFHAGYDLLVIIPVLVVA